MPESTAEKIVDILLVHPEGAEIREIAYEITKIIASIRSASIFSEILDNKKIDPKALEGLDSLIEKFKDKAGSLLQVKIIGSDSDIYDLIIYPLIMRQLDQSA